MGGVECQGVLEEEKGSHHQQKRKRRKVRKTAVSEQNEAQE